MKVLKKIIIALVVLVLIAVVVSFFLPAEVTVKRSKVVDAPIEVTYAQANNLHNFHKWDPWIKVDPNAEFSIPELHAGVGAYQVWKSEHPDVGAGKMTIVKAVPFETIETKLEFEGQGTGMGGFHFEEVEEGTKVTWWMSMELGMNPFLRIMGVFIDGMVGPKFEEGLAALAKEAENTALVGDYTTSEVMQCATIRKNISMEELESIHERLYTKIANYLAEKEVEQSGMPMAIYHNFSADMVDIECGIPVAGEVEPTDEINVIDIPAQPVVKFVHMGDYANLDKTYEVAKEWLVENGLEKAGAPWEVYVTDPGEVTDVNEWKTEIYYPVN